MALHYPHTMYISITRLTLVQALQYLERERYRTNQSSLRIENLQPPVDQYISQPTHTKLAKNARYFRRHHHHYTSGGRRLQRRRRRGTSITNGRINHPFIHSFIHSVLDGRNGRSTPCYAIQSMMVSLPLLLLL